VDVNGRLFVRILSRHLAVVMPKARIALAMSERARYQSRSMNARNGQLLTSPQRYENRGTQKYMRCEIAFTLHRLIQKSSNVVFLL